MRMRSALACLVMTMTGCVLALEVQAQSQPTMPVARIMGVAFACADLGDSDPRNCARALLHHARQRVEQDYIERRGLTATPEELAAVEAYNAAFERHDRDQRARKLVELQGRLANTALAPGERERLLAFRDILVRLARFDADVDAGTEQRTTVPMQTLRHWVERAKLEHVLHAQYGGVVGVAAFGPYAHGARIALIEEHMGRGDIELLDAEIARLFNADLRVMPAIVHDASAPDFTPFWQRPIPAASYMTP